MPDPKLLLAAIYGGGSTKVHPIDEDSKSKDSKEDYSDPEAKEKAKTKLGELIIMETKKIEEQKASVMKNSTKRKSLIKKKITDNNEERLEQDSNDSGEKESKPSGGLGFWSI